MNKNDLRKIDYMAKKLKAINMLGGKCEKCGENNMFLLEFHHKSGEEKEKIMCELKHYRWSKIEKEISKCILLCRNCHSEYHFENELNNRYKNNKKIFLEYKGMDKCEICGYDKCKASLDFHHPNNNKDFMMGEIFLTFKNISDLTYQIEEEINKCIILCKNCHVLEHWDTSFYEEHKEEIIKKSKNLKEIQSKIDRNEVKKLYDGGMKQIDIAKYFKASKGTISSIVKKLKTG